MPKKTPRQFGLWDSPFTPSSLAQSRRLEAAYFDSDGQSLVWLEGRSGQGTLVVWQGDEQAVRELTADFNVRAEVGYGGGDFTVARGDVYFVAHPSGRIWRQPLAGGEADAITPAFGRAASPVVSPDGRWVAYVHRDDDEADCLAIVDAQGKGWPQILTSGHDFYMQVRFSHRGDRLAWVAWDHPQMPWDGSLLYTAELVTPDAAVTGERQPLSPPQLNNVQSIAGGEEVSVFQPEFLPDGRMLFVSDETGWGRLALFDFSTGHKRWLTPLGVECAAPAWLQDMRTYTVCDGGREVLALFNQHGRQQLRRIDLAAERRASEDTPEEASHDEEPTAKLVESFSEYTDFTHIAAAQNACRAVVVASAPHIPPRVIALEWAGEAVESTHERTRVIARSSTETVPESALAACQALSWKTAGDETAFGLFFAPHSEKFTGWGKPPLIVMVHGGPTGQTRAGWKSEAQFFATRGFAVLYVNYRGSTGYGRQYMLRIRGDWGVVDVEDCLSGAKHLAETGHIDPERMAIMGGSAGGFTVMQTMVQHPHAFTAGVNLFGVADHFRLAFNTHKFESRYLDSLLGPLPQAAAVYRERSPALSAERIRQPLAIFQGEIDRIVPKEQSDTIVDTLRRTGVAHIYHVYQGEGHGWRKRETIEHYYRAVEEFLQRYVVYA